MDAGTVRSPGLRMGNQVSEADLWLLAHEAVERRLLGVLVAWQSALALGVDPSRLIAEYRCLVPLVRLLGGESRPLSSLPLGLRETLRRIVEDACEDACEEACDSLVSFDALSVALLPAPEI